MITANGTGNLTAGAVDMNLSAGVQSNLAVAAGSQYTIGSDGRGCMAITTVAGTQNYRFAIAASGNGHMTDFDAGGPFVSGAITKQDSTAFSTAQIGGTYAFGVSSPLDSAQGGGKFGAMGVVNLSAGSVTGGSLDANQYNATTNVSTLDGVASATAWPASAISINSGGSYTVNATTGRGTLAFTPTGGTTVNSYIYVLSATELLVIDSDVRSVNNLFSGVAYQQSGGPYANSSLNGNSVLYSSSPSSNGGGGRTITSITVGIVTATGASATFSFAGYGNSGGSIQTPNGNISGTFSVASGGRITLAGGGGGSNSLPEFLLFSPNNAFVLFSGQGAQTGLMLSQTSTTVTGSESFVMGSFSPQSVGEKDTAGVLTFSSGNLTGTTDNNLVGVLTPNNPISETYSVDSTGVVFIPASCTPGTNCTQIGTVLSSSKILLFDAESSGAGGTTTPQWVGADQ